ncbi:MAG: hypothetical protein H0W08_01630 [Acidobacteria bacterium]|nr:hypothetical protein [Acidobacteriota bacterium]
MRGSAVSLILLIVLSADLPGQQDALNESRRLYNAGQFESAESAARLAMQQPATANSARVLLGRIHLERFRKSPSELSLEDARKALREVDPALLDTRERLELTVGFGETLFLEDRFGAAAEMFAPVLEASSALGPGAHERVLDWWATSVDRQAQARPMAERPAIYVSVIQRMTAELWRDPGSAPAGYWLVAAARGSGDLDTAWSAAMAGWVRATLSHDRGGMLRGDLDRLVVQAIIPERAARLSPRDPSRALTGLLSDWEAFKAGWTK